MYDVRLEFLLIRTTFKGVISIVNRTSSNRTSQRVYGKENINFTNKGGCPRSLQ